MQVPAAGLPQALQGFLRDLLARVELLEVPQGFMPTFTLASSQLTAANAADNPNRWCAVSDLKVSAWSDGAHWYRSDTGAVIV